MRHMMEKYGRRDVDHIAIILTDGKPNLDYHKTVPEARKAKKQNIEIIAVGMLLLMNIIAGSDNDCGNEDLTKQKRQDNNNNNCGA